MTTTEQHPNFPTNANVRHISYRVRGVVHHSTSTDVWVTWDNGTIGHFNGWQAGNSLRKLA